MSGAAQGLPGLWLCGQDSLLCGVPLAQVRGQCALPVVGGGGWAGSRPLRRLVCAAGAGGHRTRPAVPSRPAPKAWPASRPSRAQSQTPPEPAVPLTHVCFARAQASGLLAACRVMGPWRAARFGLRALRLLLLPWAVGKLTGAGAAVGKSKVE